MDDLRWLRLFVLLFAYWLHSVADPNVLLPNVIVFFPLGMVSPVSVYATLRIKRIVVVEMHVRPNVAQAGYRADDNK